MPVIRIEVPEGVPVATKRRIREGAKQAVLDTASRRLRALSGESCRESLLWWRTVSALGASK